MTTVSQLVWNSLKGLYGFSKRFYREHTRFVNDGIVELVCLIIANSFIWVFSYYFVGPALVIILLSISTPITFGIKYSLHKLWVWKN